MSSRLQQNCYGFTAPKWLLETSLSLFYFQLGFIYASWISRLPDTQTALGIDNGELGLVLVCAIFGGMLGLPLATWLINKIGSGNSLYLGSLAASILFPIAGATMFGIWVICFGVLGIGFGMAMLDVSSNAHAVCVERAFKSNVLGKLQAANSVGSLAGVLFGGFMASMNVSCFFHFAGVGIVGAALDTMFMNYLVNVDYEKHLEEKWQKKSTGGNGYSSIEDTDTTEDNNALLSSEDLICGFNKPLATLCVLGFLNLMGCGSVNDWSTVYFQDAIQATPFYTSMGYAFFITFTFIGQIASDTLVKEYGPRNLLTFSGFMAFIGLSIVVMAPSLNFTLQIWAYGPFVTAVAGFAIAGAGMSSIGPILISQTGKLKIEGMTSAGKIGALTACSYLGLLVGPPIFGGLSVLLKQLRWALLVDACLMFLIAPLARIIFMNTGRPRILNMSISGLFNDGDLARDGSNNARTIASDGDYEIVA